MDGYGPPAVPRDDRPHRRRALLDGCSGGERGDAGRTAGTDARTDAPLETVRER